MAVPRSRAFAQVDVFASTPLGGNPVAVVLDGTDLDADAMAAFARWTNLSETTFVLPPDTPGADYRLRIFTPGAELPFAGHPTLGSAHAWLEAGGVPRDPALLVQSCAAGPVRVRRSGSSLAFAAPPTTRSGPLDDALLARVTAALGVRADAVLAHQWVDNGPGWLALQLASAAAVLDLEPDLAAVPDLKIGVLGAHPDGHPLRWEVRAFAPALGLGEDPVTGSLNASLAQWLLREGRTASRYRVGQGARVGRTGVLDVEQDAAGTVWVGGATTTVVRGTVTL
ncbi:PhzF family phenazine biosynthesis protein [Microlunatus capsulatus]|uniref:PhzF family phenazine biosynthesis protein n=1 Tax=Microlunatus capsulatus TaxID=99117 RepID=A0ABS4Z3U6_9ACTN|nr:PhzF family phenazine biosynthesis protein [Microlunatus capsulatus]MBP2415717.1 PhzF family phenazine biosynthesis protein [Microlunatus capsulatus]